MKHESEPGKSVGKGIISDRGNSSTEVCVCETAWGMQDAAGRSGLLGQEVAGGTAGAVMGEVKDGLGRGRRGRPSAGRAYSHSPL